MKRTLSVVLVSLLTLAMLSGCNTWRGVGQDIEKAGEGIQNSANK
ncbi:entericidin A/B family lipoprotein [Halomonas cupida]